MILERSKREVVNLEIRKIRNGMLIVCMLVVFLSVLSPTVTFGADKSGICGENAAWMLSDNGVLTITGHGKTWDFRNDGDGQIWNFDYHGESPWKNFEDSIVRVVIDEGITYLGANAFTSCQNLETVQLPSTLKTISCFCFLARDLKQSTFLMDSRQ